MGKLENPVVKCDLPGCNWSKKIELSQITDWHNKLCPKCHKCVIITDDDLKLHKAVMEFAEADERLADELGIPKDFVGGQLKIDSSLKSNDGRFRL